MARVLPPGAAAASRMESAGCGFSASAGRREEGLRGYNQPSLKPGKVVPPTGTPAGQ